MGRLTPLHQMTIVMRKELKDSLRDRRALFSIAFSIVVGPVLIGFMMNRIADRQREWVIAGPAQEMIGSGARTRIKRGGLLLTLRIDQRLEQQRQRNLRAFEVKAGEIGPVEETPPDRRVTCHQPKRPATIIAPQIVGQRDHAPASDGDDRPVLDQPAHDHRSRRLDKDQEVLERGRRGHLRHRIGSFYPVVSDRCPGVLRHHKPTVSANT